jgi:hypothetical protein
LLLASGTPPARSLKRGGRSHKSARAPGSSACAHYDRIWSAPAALVNYALLGWFIGLARSKLGLVLQLLLNLCNMWARERASRYPALRAKAAT